MGFNFMLPSMLNFILAWYNLPFTLLLAICLLLAALQWIGLGGESDGDADADADADGDVDAEPGTDLDQDLDGELEPDAEAGDGSDAEPAPAAGSESGFSLLAYLGVGRAPLLVTLLLLFGAVGLAGWIFNSLALQLFGIYPAPVIAATLILSLGTGSLVSSRVTRAIGRTLPPVSTTATPAQAVVGRRGTVISPFVDRRYGMVHLRDAAGTLISVFAITQDETPIRRGEEVIFIDYDAHKRLYTVVRANR